MKKKILLLILMISFCLVFTACQKEASENNPITKVGTWKTAQTIQPYFYDQFLPAGQKIEILPFTNPGDQKTALLAGSLDVCGTTLATAITAASKGEPVVIIASLCNKCSALVVKNDSDIQTAKDLKGKKIAYVPGTLHHILLLDTLKRNNISLDEVTLVRIDFFDMGKALNDGTIDAFCSGEPYPSEALAKGYGRILSYPYFDDSIGAINGALITTQKNIEEKPQLIEDITKAHIEATEYLKENPQIWLDKAVSFGNDQAVLNISAKNIELCWNMDEGYINQSKKLAQKMLELGVIDKLPDFDKLFNTNFLQNNH